MLGGERVAVGVQDLIRRDAKLARGKARRDLWVGGDIDGWVDPERDIDGRSCLSSRAFEVLELVDRVHRDPDARLDREGEVRGTLRAPVEEEVIWAHPGRKGERKLSGRENIRPGAHRCERPEYRQVAVRLCGVKHPDLRIVGDERPGEAPEVPADTCIVGDVEWGSEPFYESHCVVFTDMEMSAPDREVGGEDHRSSPRIRSTASAIRSIERVMANLTNPSPFRPKPTPGVATIPAWSRSCAANAMQSSTGAQT